MTDNTTYRLIDLRHTALVVESRSLCTVRLPDGLLQHTPNVTESNNRMSLRVTIDGQQQEWRDIYIVPGFYDIRGLHLAINEAIGYDLLVLDEIAPDVPSTITVSVWPVTPVESYYTETDNGCRRASMVGDVTNVELSFANPSRVTDINNSIGKVLGFYTDDSVLRIDECTYAPKYPRLGPPVPHRVVMSIRRDSDRALYRAHFPLSNSPQITIGTMSFCLEKGTYSAVYVDVYDQYDVPIDCQPMIDELLIHLTPLELDDRYM